jgi:signal transduction histidine kinase
MYAVAAWRSTRFAMIIAGLSIGAHLPWSLLVETDPEGPLLTMAATASWIAAPVAIGIAMRTRRRSRAESRVEGARRADYEQRLRIAQEVHDVVGHSLAVISVNAGAALHVLLKDADPSPQLQRSLQAIRQASGSALDELRSTLATFTGTVAAPPANVDAPVGGEPMGADSEQDEVIGGGPSRHQPDQPQPGLAMLPRLAAATEAAGLSVRCEFAGERRGELPADAQLAAYRIVQEALTNVVRHAGARHALVAVAYRPDGVRVTVTDDGRSAAAAAVRPPGTGLASMRDRAASVAATLTAGPRHGGGFEVRVLFGYEAARRDGVPS